MTRLRQHRQRRWTAKRSAQSAIKARVESVAKLLKIGHVLAASAARTVQRPEAAHGACPRAGRLAAASCCSTIPCAMSTPSCASRCGSNCRACCRRSGSTVLYVTQDYKEAMALGDRIAVLLEGDIVQVGTPERDLSRAGQRRGRAAVRRPHHQPARRRARAPMPAGSDVGLSNAQVHLPAAYEHGGRPRLRARPAAGSDRASSTARPRQPFPVEVVAVTPLNEKTVLLLRTARRPRNPGLRGRQRRGAAPPRAGPCRLRRQCRPAVRSRRAAPHRLPTCRRGG